MASAKNAAMEPSKPTDDVTCAVSANLRKLELMIIAALTTRRHGMQSRHAADEKVGNSQQDQDDGDAR